MKDEGACVGCGYCCQKAPCFLSALRFGRPQCPALVHDGQRYRCGVYLSAAQQDPELGRRVAEELAIDAGCSSSLFNTIREAQLKKDRELVESLAGET